jgi:hypothetical protein
MFLSCYFRLPFALRLAFLAFCCSLCLLAATVPFAEGEKGEGKRESELLLEMRYFMYWIVLTQFYVSRTILIHASLVFGVTLYLVSYLSSIVLLYPNNKQYTTYL